MYYDEKEIDHEGTRTLNLPIRSRTPYPLGHAANHTKEKASEKMAFERNQNIIFAETYVLISENYWTFFQMYYFDAAKRQKSRRFPNNHRKI